MNISTESVNIFFINSNIINNLSNRNFCLEFLDDYELSKYHSYCFDKEKNNFLSSRVVLKQILSYYLKCDAKTIVFQYGEFGKPFLMIDGQASKVEFNVSHSFNFSTFAFCLGRSVGIDLERVNKDIDVFEIAKGFFHPHEVNTLLRANYSYKFSTFYDFWTLKESIMKATGKGLNIDLKNFFFDLRKDKKIIIKSGAYDYLNEYSWCFWIFQYRGVYRGAICLADSECLSSSPEFKAYEFKSISQFVPLQIHFHNRIDVFGQII